MTIKTDTFTEASTDTNIASHTSDTGGSWQGGETSQLTVLTATGDVQSATGVNNAICDETISSTDYFAEITGTMGGVAANDRIGVVVRGQDGATHHSGTSFYYVFRMSGDSGWNLFRVEGATGQQSDNISGTLSNATYISDNGIGTSDQIKMKMSISGTGSSVTLTLSLDFNTGGGFGGYSVVSTAVDTDVNKITTAGAPGIYIRDANSRITYFNAEYLAYPYYYYAQQA